MLYFWVPDMYEYGLEGCLCGGKSGDCMLDWRIELFCKDCGAGKRWGLWVYNTYEELELLEGGLV